MSQVATVGGRLNDCENFKKDLSGVAVVLCACFPNRTNKMPDGAMTDGSKRRHEAVMSASDSEDGLGSYSFISDTGDSPPLFPCFPTGLPGTHKWGDNWEADIDYEEVDFSVPKPAWIKDSYHWSCTLLKMGKFAASPITYHAFVVKVFNKSADECRTPRRLSDSSGRS